MAKTDNGFEKQDLEKQLKQSEDRFREIIEKTPAGVCITSETGIFEYVNPAYCKIYGYSSEELIGKHFTIVVPEAYKKQLSDLHDQFIIEKTEIRGEWEVLNKQKKTLHILADAALITGNDGRPKKVTFVINISDRKKAEASLAELNASLEKRIWEKTSEMYVINTDLKRNRDHLTEAQAIGQMGSWEWDIKKDRLEWSDEVYTLFGVEPENFDSTIGNFMATVHPDDRELVKHTIEKSIAELSPYSVEHRILLSNGQVKIVFEKGKVEADSRGKPIRMFGIVQDITDKKQIESEMKMLSNAIDESINSIFITDLSGAIIYVNQAFESLTGYLKEDIINQHSRILSSGNTPAETYRELWEIITEGITWRGELQNRNKQGDIFWVNCTILPIRNEIGEVFKFMSIQEDISIKYLAERESQYLSTHDPLTGLLNRKHFISLIEKRLFSTTQAALISIDIDDFNYVNEKYGSSTGDDILKTAAASLMESTAGQFGDQIILARIGENKFTAFIDDLSGKAALAFADQFREAFYHLPKKHVTTALSLSAGIVAFPDHGKTIDALLNALDDSLFLAKRSGKNRCQLYDGMDKNISDRSIKVGQRERILKALDEDRFVPWYQPILNMNDGHVHHFEVLARMTDENGDIVLPGAFIPAAESYGLIGEIDKVIAEKAMIKLKGVQSCLEDIAFAFNLSGKEIESLSHLEFIKEIINKTGVSAKSLIFEITETAAIQDLKKAITFIAELKKLGCAFSLDDFGVGFTSFSYLKELDVDYIKIDGAFIRKLDSNPQDQVIVRAMTGVAQGFKIQTIAEFVENDTILKMLGQLSVDYAQGYHIGKPGPEPVFELPCQA